MSGIDVRSSDGTIARSPTAPYVRGASRTGPIKYIPGFLYILALFIVGKFIFPDPRATLVEWGQYHLSWVEVLMVAAAMMAMAEQLKVSYPGVDNTGSSRIRVGAFLTKTGAVRALAACK